MAFQFPENIVPECYPMAWLIGSWKGAGVMEYEGIEAQGFLHELHIDNDTLGPYLRLRSTTWLIEEDAGIIDKEISGGAMYAKLTKSDVWSDFSAYLRPNPTVEKQGEATVLEGMSISPSGYSATWAGIIQGPQIHMQADAIACTPNSPDYQGARIMGGLVESDLFFAYDMAAFGQEMATYMSGRLSRADLM
ncbi:MAG: FABP family protein [Actinomycetaceae bacterium]|nr:FABP family protein [Actinomycetaceae bacterium]